MQPARLLNEMFFGAAPRTDAPETDVAVGAAVVQVVPANARRLKLELSNAGPTNITIRRDDTVTPTTGYYIPAGGNYVIDWLHEFGEVTKGVWAIGSAAGGALHVREVVSVA